MRRKRQRKTLCQTRLTSTYSNLKLVILQLGLLHIIYMRQFIRQTPKPMIPVLLLQIRYVHFRKLRGEQNQHRREDLSRIHGATLMCRIEPTKRRYLTLTESIDCEFSDLSTRRRFGVNFAYIYVNPNSRDFKNIRVHFYHIKVLQCT